MNTIKHSPRGRRNKIVKRKRCLPIPNTHSPYDTTIRALSMSFSIIASLIADSSLTSHFAERKRPLNHSLSCEAFVS